LDQLGLVQAIHEQAERYNTASGADGEPGLHIDVQAPGDLPLLSAAVEVAAYRIAQEALANAARHARARTCVVRLALHGPTRPVASANGLQPGRVLPAGTQNPVLWLEIVDDGIGLPTAPRPGVGLTSMRERAAELGGTCTVERGPTGGTRVEARLPLGEPSTVAADDDRPGVPDADEASPPIGGDG
jgi:signal transduction histidine kinase